MISYISSILQPSSPISELTDNDQEENILDDETLVYQDDRFKLQLYSNHQHKELLVKFKNWSKNRPPDMNRISEIYNYYVLNQYQLVDGIIYVWNHNDNYYIYDGIHRFSAMLDIDYEMYFLVSHCNSNRENDIIQHYISLNKSINVPLLYLEMNDNDSKKKVCESIAKELCFKYPHFSSSSRNPRIPNFNRDCFIDFLSSLSIDFTHLKAAEIISNSLIELNQRAKKQYESSSTTPLKCHKYDFYLFLYSFSDLRYKIQQFFQLSI